jgi:hypothetical protein
MIFAEKASLDPRFPVLNFSGTVYQALRLDARVSIAG